MHTNDDYSHGKTFPKRDISGYVFEVLWLFSGYIHTFTNYSKHVILTITCLISQQNYMRELNYTEFCISEEAALEALHVHFHVVSSPPGPCSHLLVVLALFAVNFQVMYVKFHRNVASCERHDIIDNEINLFLKLMLGCLIQITLYSGK